MHDLDKFLADVKHLEKSLFGLILSSFLFSLIAVLAQPASATIQFKALTELVGGIMGSAGVLSVYLSGLHHPKDDYGYLLDFEPFGVGVRAVLSLMFALLMFYLFYRFAANGTELSFIFLGMGMFMFFRTIAGSAQTIRRAELQRAVWRSLSDESRDKWFERRDKLKEALEGAQSTIQDVKLALKESKEHHRRYKRDSRRRAWQARLNAISRRWLKLRLKLGGTWLLTAPERTKLKGEELRAEEYVSERFSELRREDVQKIRSGKVHPQRVEALNVDVFKTGGAEYYFFLPSDTTLERARSFVELVPTLKRLAGLDNLWVLAIVPADGILSLEARSELSKYGIEIVEETPTTSTSPVAPA